MDYLAEIKKLPKDIQAILISTFGAQVNGEIIATFSLSEEQGESFIDLVNDVYLKQVEIYNLQEELSKRLRLNPKKTLELATEIAGKKLLIADDYFKGKVTDYLQGLKVNLSKYAPIVASELNAIEKEMELVEDVKDSPSFNDVLGDEVQDEDFVEESKKDTLELFKDDLGKILSLGPEYNEIITDYNDDLEEYLNDEDFARELEKIIITNSSVITRVKPIINDESKNATVANWLKDFISFHGSDNFNAIVLAEYLVNSQSAKRLSASDKKKIKRLLNIYRNVSFFAEVIASNQGRIEVIPLENESHDDEIKKDIVKEDKKIPVTDNEIKVKNKKEELESAIRESESFGEKTEEKETEKEEKPTLVNELESMLQDYTPDTLEYKTITQEIKRLKSKEK